MVKMIAKPLDLNDPDPAVQQALAELRDFMGTDSSKEAVERAVKMGKESGPGILMTGEGPTQH